MSARPIPATPTWNLLVTSLEGQRESLLRVLRTLARFRRGGFPNVLVATVEDPRGFLTTLRDLCESSPTARAGLGKVVPIDRTVRFAQPATFVDEMTALLTPLQERLAGRTFFVRIFRRGFRGVLDSTSAEGEIGARLVALLQARGEHPRVSFRDPDVALAIHTLHDEAGVAFLDRDVRTAFPFVRIR